MELGIIGMGRMGANMAKRLVEAGHRVVAFDRDAAAVKAAASAGVVPAASLGEMVSLLAAPRAVWVMVPHGPPTEATLGDLSKLLSAGDVLIDGGNSHYLASIAVAKRLAERKIDFIDAGVSGGIWGLKEGYCLMVGGPKPAVDRLGPIWKTLAPAEGFAHVGESGAGHFVKMIHNAIEYGMLQSIGEGFACLEKSTFKLDLPEIANLWRRGSVVRSWLIDLLADAFERNGANLGDIGGVVDDSGTGRWTIGYAVENAIPLPAITGAVYARFESKMENPFAARIVAALRNEFGGHATHQETKTEKAK